MTDKKNKRVPDVNPFATNKAPIVNEGVIEIEKSKAVMEAQGKLVIAKNFPRNKAQAYAEIMGACKMKDLAEESAYSYPRGGKTVTGPSIRLAEELARLWGNLDYGIKELSQKDGVSEMYVSCWDLETNTNSYQVFTVKHERHTSSGVKILTDPRDIYELTANMGGRRLRARILAILPKVLVNDAIAQCAQTLIGDTTETLEQRIPKMITKFADFQVTHEMIEARIGKKVTEITPENLVELIQIYQSIKEGVFKAVDYFGGDEAKDTGTEAEELNAAVKAIEEPAITPVANDDLIP